MATVAAIGGQTADDSFGRDRLVILASSLGTIFEWYDFFVYGTLAALPVFLIWIYVCWLIVLTGAAITATLTLPADAVPQRVAEVRRS